MQLFYNLVFRKLQQQLLGAGIAELNGSLGVLTSTLDLDDGTDAETLVLDDRALLQGITLGSRRRRCTRSYRLVQALEIRAKGVNGFLRLTGSHLARLGIGSELRSHWSRILHPI